MLSCAPSPFQEGFNQHWFSRKLFKVNFKDRPEFFPDWLSWEIGECGFKILILPTISFNHSLSSTPPPHPVSSQTLVLSPSFLSILIFSPPPYLTLCSFRGLFPQEGAASKQFSPKGGFFCVCSNITKWVSLANEQLGGRAGMWRGKRWKKFQVKFSISQFWAKQEWTRVGKSSVWAMGTSVTATCITAQVTTCIKGRRDAGLENHTYLPQGHWPCIHSLSGRTGLFCLLQEFSDRMNDPTTFNFCVPSF